MLLARVLSTLLGIARYQHLHDRGDRGSQRRSVSEPGIYRTGNRHAGDAGRSGRVASGRANTPRSIAARRGGSDAGQAGGRRHGRDDSRQGVLAYGLLGPR